MSTRPAARPRSLLRDRATRRAVAATFTGTLSAGTAPLGIVLLCRSTGFSYTETGLVLAGEAAGLLLGGPGRGRAVDRRGQHAALLGFAGAHAIALLAFLAAADGGAPVAVLVVLACAASATFPPFTAVLRERWSTLLPDPAERQRGFAAQAITQEAVFVAGPLVATTTAALGAPSAIIPVMVVLVVLGTAELLVDAPRQRPAAHPSRHPLGALVAPGVRVVVLTHVPIGIALGAIDLTAVWVAEHSGRRALAGLLLTTFSIASAAGGVAWSRRRGIDPRRAFPRLAIAFGVGMLPLLAATTFVAALPLMALAGAVFAPFVATVYALLDEVALPGTTAEATTWLTTAMGLGAMLGSAAAGALVDSAGPGAAFGVAAAGAALASAVALGGGRWLGPPAPAGGPPRSID